jgi:phage protein D
MTATDVGSSTVWPTVLVGSGGTALPAIAENCLSRTEVDTHLLLPGMFALTFEDLTGAALDKAGLDIGVQVRVQSGSDSSSSLITGEITAIEGYYRGLTGWTVVRGYDLCHRLQRARRTRSFEEMTDSDIATQLANEAKLPIGEITPTTTVHEHLLQCNQTDWEFLAQRAAETGFEFGMADGKFRFGKASTVADSDAGLPELDIPGPLLRFEPRVTAANVTPDVEVRVWDPLQATLSTAAPIPTAASGASAASPQGLTEVAGLFSTGGEAGPADEPSSAGGADLGPAPSPTAYVVSTLPVDSAESAASALAAAVGGTFAEAEGEAIGNSAIHPGATVKVSGLPGRFPTRWLVTRARHVFDLTENGYRTEFSAGGRNDRSLLGMTATGGANPARIPGVVCGIVDDIGDEHARVRLTLPWLSPQAHTDWAPVVQFGAGKRSGAMFLPEVGDEVLVGFEFGDPRRPYVLGGLVTQQSNYDLGGSPVIQGPGGADSSVARRGFVSASGSKLVFHDEMGEDPKPQAAQITLGSGDGTLGLGIDIVQGTLELTCAPEDPTGQLTIKCGQAGVVNIVTGQGGTVTIDGGDSLTLKSATSITVQSQGTVSVTGQSISLGG